MKRSLVVLSFALAAAAAAAIAWFGWLLDTVDRAEFESEHSHGGPA